MRKNRVPDHALGGRTPKGMISGEGNLDEGITTLSTQYTIYDQLGVPLGAGAARLVSIVDKKESIGCHIRWRVYVYA